MDTLRALIAERLATAERVMTEREVCKDCGRMAARECPLGATTCSACSVLRDVVDVPEATYCAAHGEYLPEVES